MGKCTYDDCRRKERRARREKQGKRHHREWNALDPSCTHGGGCGSGHNGTQSGEQTNKTIQMSEETIKIIDSCDITVSTTDTKGALSLQAGLQAALVIIVTITLFGGDTEKAEKFTQDLIQTAKIKQVNHQMTYIENSRDITVVTNDTHLAANIQLLLQLLIAVALIVDIF